MKKEEIIELIRSKIKRNNFKRDLSIKEMGKYACDFTREDNYVEVINSFNNMTKYENLVWCLEEILREIEK